ncbi:hypothetical protein D8X92_08290 [Listeria ivanovii]|nr:hypothetical protein [Listeria ivanovii]
MSIQLKLIIALTKLINVKKIFTLEDQTLRNEIAKKQKNRRKIVFKGMKKKFCRLMTMDCTDFPR